MGFVFVHTADWQVGRRFRAFEAGLASALEDARLDAIDTLAATATSSGARHVLVAGDVFDGEDVPARTLRQVFERMRQHTSVSWWLLPGNHDPARPNGLWTRFAAIASPSGGRPSPTANIVTLLDPSPREIEPGVVLLPAPLTARTSPHDPTAWMDDAVTPAGAMRIGLAHGSIKGFGGDDAANVPIDPQRARKARLDYLALGDWHGTVRIDPRTWYSGTPEPDSFDGNDPGHALIVRMREAGAEPTVERVYTARYQWRQIAAKLGKGAGVDAIDRDLAASDVPLQRQIVKLALTGKVGAEQFEQVASWRDTLEARLRFLDADLSRLVVQAPAGDGAALLDGDPVLGPLAAKLRQMECAAEGAEARAAGVALQKLLDFDRRSREAAE